MYVYRQGWWTPCTPQTLYHSANTVHVTELGHEADRSETVRVDDRKLQSQKVVVHMALAKCAATIVGLGRAIETPAFVGGWSLSVDDLGPQPSIWCARFAKYVRMLAACAARDLLVSPLLLILFLYQLYNNSERKQSQRLSIYLTWLQKCKLFLSLNT